MQDLPLRHFAVVPEEVRPLCTELSCSFMSRSVVPRAGFEPAITRSSAERSPRLSYLGTLPQKNGGLILKLSESFSEGEKGCKLFLRLVCEVRREKGEY